MRTLPKRTLFASLCIFWGASLQVTAQEPRHPLPATPQVPAGLNALKGDAFRDAITVEANQTCTSRSSGSGVVFQAQYGKGVMCISGKGFAYVNLDQTFSQSSRGQTVRPGRYGPSGNLGTDKGERATFIVLSDTTQCVLNPTFKLDGTWSGKADDGKTNRHGLTVVSRGHHILCISPVDSSVVVFDPKSGGTMAASVRFGNFAQNPLVYIRSAAQQILDAIDRRDDLMGWSGGGIKAAP